jgi:hypothetical protein
MVPAHTQIRKTLKDFEAESYNIMCTAKRKTEVRENVVAEHSADAGPTAGFILNIDFSQHQLLHM